jgi:hypothetical protein
MSQAQYPDRIVCFVERYQGNVEATKVWLSLIVALNTFLMSC